MPTLKTDGSPLPRLVCHIRAIFGTTETANTHFRDEGNCQHTFLGKNGVSERCSLEKCTYLSYVQRHAGLYFVNPCDDFGFEEFFEFVKSFSSEFHGRCQIAKTRTNACVRRRLAELVWATCCYFDDCKLLSPSFYHPQPRLDTQITGIVHVEHRDQPLEWG